MINENLFWGKTISTIDTLDGEEKYSLPNFDGKNSLSVFNHARIVRDFLISSYSFNNFLDIGASIGLLSSLLLECDVNAYAIDGCDYGVRNGLIKVPNERYAVIDLSSSLLSSYLPAKHFDLCTSFELMEHVPEEKLDKVIDNIMWVSKTLICSLHTGGREEGNHYTIRSLEWWMDKFRPYGSVRQLSLSIPTFNESSFIEVKSG